MPIISESIDQQVIDSFARGYSEHQIARMFNLRVAAVRRIRSEYSATFRKKQDALSIGERIHDDVFNTYFKQQHSGCRVDLHNLGAVSGRTSGKELNYGNVPKLDFAGLEAHVLSGFFTVNGQPTPAFWGYVNQWCKKSGHVLLDILHDHEIFAPEQLERALDIYQQVDDMDSVQLATLLRVVAQKVYETNVKDPISTGTNVPDSE